MPKKPVKLLSEYEKLIRREVKADMLEFIVKAAVGLFVGALIFWAFYLANQSWREEADAWDTFKSEHNCRDAGVMRGDVVTAVGVGANGQVAVGVGATPDKTGWQCDDGKTYWR